jgi:hypothetical protein
LVVAVLVADFRCFAWARRSCPRLRVRWTYVNPSLVLFTLGAVWGLFTLGAAAGLASGGAVAVAGLLGTLGDGAGSASVCVALGLGSGGCGAAVLKIPASWRRAL